MAIHHTRWFRSEEVDRMLNGDAQGRRDFSSKIWALLFFEMWCREWLDQPVREEAAVTA